MRASRVPSTTDLSDVVSRRHELKRKVGATGCPVSELDKHILFCGIVQTLQEARSSPPRLNGNWISFEKRRGETKQRDS